MIYPCLSLGRLSRCDAYSIWVRGLIATIFVSLLFDVRDVFLYFTS